MLIGIKVPHETARLLLDVDVPGDKCEVSEQHITLFYFPETNIDDLLKATQLLFELISDTNPFMIQSNIVNAFPKTEHSDDLYPIKLDFTKNKQLIEWREQMADILDENKISYANNFSYNPHVTLSYSEKDFDEVKIDPVQWVVNEVVIWYGEHGDNKLTITIPLKSPQIKNAKLINKTNIFNKLAKM